VFTRPELEQHITRQTSIDGKPLTVVDDLFSAEQIASLHRLLTRMPYHLNDYDTEDTRYALHWKAELLIPFALSTPVLQECAALKALLFPDDASTLARAHVNLMLYGDAQYPHTDTQTAGITVLYYANPEWREKWFGETVFYDAGRESVAAVSPRPGRVVMFDARIIHRAGVPSRECFLPRMTVAFKYHTPQP
jgi:SM-20-related protein